MRQTRSSARLAHAAAVKPEPDQKGAETLTGKPKVLLTQRKEEVGAHDSDFEDKKEEGDEFEEHEISAPKRKRACTTRATKPAPRKRQVRGKQGRLESLMKMPTDIFTEITLHLMPRDIIALSRSNKFFRNLLMNRSAIHIWHGAMRNIPGLPPCPPDMSEPHYLALIYARNCSMCGVTVSRRMDEMLRVRLCPACRNDSLISISRVSFEIHNLVLSSSKIMPSKRRWDWDSHTFKSDVKEVQARLDEFKASDDQLGLEKWKETRQEELSARRAQARELIAFLDGVEEDRDAELSGLRHERRQEIHRRLLEHGWEEEDLEFPYYKRRDWDALVEQPKPLTNRIWENLRPKLIPLLEANREDRLKQEKAERMRDCRECLDEYLSGIKNEREPILDVTIRVPVIPVLNAAHTSDSPTSNIEPSTVYIKHIGVFPEIVDALEWDTMQDLLEKDLPAGDMLDLVDAVRPEIVGKIYYWIHNVDTHLAGLLRQGREEDELSAEVPELTLPVVGDSSTDPFEDVTSDQKLLLRADSLFMSNRIGDRQPPLVYDALVAFGYRTQMNLDLSRAWRPSKAPLDLSKFKRHTKAQAVARMLLEHVGKPNATFLEMRSAGQNYMCGRCHDVVACTWEEIVQHYVYHRQTWERIVNHAELIASYEIIFRDVHDPAFETDKPMIRIVSRDEMVAEASGYLHGLTAKICNLCQKVRILPLVRAKEEKILEHLRDVHNVSEPKVPEHYGTSILGGIFGGMYLGDQYDPYGDSDDDMWDDLFASLHGDMPWDDV